MRSMDVMLNRPAKPRSALLILLGGLLLVVLGYAGWSFAKESAPKTFSSAAEACQALHQAVTNGDVKSVETILGVGREFTSSGDDAQDKLEREQFAQKYAEMHRLVKEPDGTTVLYIGAENWPFPIPLASKNGRWYFDWKTGTQEMLFRRVGENETTAIEVCRALLTAEKSAGNATGDDPINRYAEKLVAAKPSEGTSAPSGTQETFSGYYFRVLAKPVKISGGKGLVSVAYPAKYRSSGVMSFIVTEDGVVYQKDLGPNTAKLARSIKQRPTSGWALVN